MFFLSPLKRWQFIAVKTDRQRERVSLLASASDISSAESSGERSSVGRNNQSSDLGLSSAACYSTPQLPDHFLEAKHKHFTARGQNFVVKLVASVHNC